MLERTVQLFSKTFKYLQIWFTVYLLWVNWNKTHNLLWKIGNNPLHSPSIWGSASLANILLLFSILGKRKQTALTAQRDKVGDPHSSMAQRLRSGRPRSPGGRSPNLIQSRSRRLGKAKRKWKPAIHLQWCVQARVGKTITKFFLHNKI